MHGATQEHEKAGVTFQKPERMQVNQQENQQEVQQTAEFSSKGAEKRESFEYELAWEFEMWRRTEEAKWRAELKEKETSALRALEEDFKRKQVEQTAAIDKVRLDLANLESKLRAKLLAVEKRDRSLHLAEEDSSLRREALERECAQRVADAEAAVRRLEADCQQRLELEHTRYSMLEQQYGAVEVRLANANSSLDGVEKEFSAYKATQRMSSEAELTAQILVLKHQCHEFEKKTEAAMRSREDYKLQVVRLAKELAGMHRKQDSSKVRDSSLLASFVEAHNRKESVEKLELKHLKQQVERLQAQEQTAVTAATAAAIAAATVSRKASEPYAAAAPNESGGETTESKQRGESMNLTTDAVAVAPDDQKIPGEKSNCQEEEINADDDDTFRPQVSISKNERHSLKEQQSDDSSKSEPFWSHISAFQKAEIVRLKKQKADLLHTGQ